MTDTAKQVRVAFFRTRDGAEPVREWLRSMPKEDRQQIGVDLKTVEYGWPIGMPTCRALGEGLWEVLHEAARQRSSGLLLRQGSEHDPDARLCEEAASNAAGTPAVGAGSQATMGRHIA